MKHLCLSFVLLFLCGTTAVWGETLGELQQRAESGDSDAQYDLAMRYWEGKEGAPKDNGKAFYWAKKSAEQGDAYAQSWVAYFYENGYGTAQDDSESFYWYRRSADQGNRVSQNNLGECYYYGRGVDQSYEKATSWYKKAADQGLASAMFNMGWCYEKGQGVVADRSLAVNYYRKATAAGDENARKRLVELGESVDGGSTSSSSTTSSTSTAALSSSTSGSHVNPSTLANARSGIDVSQFVVGQQYFDDGNYEQARYWWREASKQGYGKASLKLGECYYDGLGTDRNFTTAAYWYSEAAEQGEREACFKLGTCYETGVGVIKDYQIAVKYYDKGGYLTASAICARKWLQQYRSGFDYAAATAGDLQWRANNGDALAQCHLGLLLYTDDKTSEAKEWFKKCAENSRANNLSKSIAKKYVGLIEAVEAETEEVMELFFGF